MEQINKSLLTSGSQAVLELLLGSIGDGRSQRWEDPACLGETKARPRWFRDEPRKDKRYQWKNAEDGSSKHKAQRSAKEEIYEWKDKRMHRIRLEKSVKRRMKRRCIYHLNWKYMMHIKNLMQRCFQPHLQYTLKDSHEGVWYQKERFQSKHDLVYRRAKISLLGGIYWAWGES